MAQTRGQQRGNAAKAPKSVPLTNNPDPEHFLDLIEYIQGRPHLVVQAKRGTRVRGYAPGDDEDQIPRMLTIPVGGVARVEVDRSPAVEQDASVLALLVANGKLDIVPAEHFRKARPHREIHDEIRQAELAAEARRGGSGESLLAQVAALRQEIAELKAAQGGGVEAS